MVVQVNPYGIIRRVLVAAVTGTLPDEHRQDALHILTEAMRSADDDLRGLAVIGIYEVGGPPHQLLPPLIRALRDPSDIVRRRAARSLGEMGTDALPAIPYLTAALEDPQVPVRMEVVHAIGRIGPEAEAALPGLVPLLGDDDCRIRTIIGMTMRRIGSGAVPYLLALLDDPDPILRERAVCLVGQIGDSNDDVIAALLRICMDEEPEVRHAAREVLDNLAAEQLLAE